MTSRGFGGKIVGATLGSAALALALAAVALAGCGGGDEGGAATDTEAVISKEEFIEQADAICAESGDAQAEAQAVLEAATDAEQTASAYEGLAEVFGAVDEEIDSLGRPQGDEALIDELSSKQSEVASLVGDLAAAVRAEDQAEAQRIASDIDQLVAETGELIDGYGFEVC